MQHNYIKNILEKTGSIGNSKRNADPANYDPLPIWSETEIYGCRVKFQVAPLDNT